MIKRSDKNHFFIINGESYVHNNELVGDDSILLHCIWNKKLDSFITGSLTKQIIFLWSGATVFSQKRILFGKLVEAEKY